MHRYNKEERLVFGASVGKWKMVIFRCSLSHCSDEGGGKYFVLHEMVIIAPNIQYSGVSSKMRLHFPCVFVSRLRTVALVLALAWRYLKVGSQRSLHVSMSSKPYEKQPHNIENN